MSILVYTIGLLEDMIENKSKFTIIFIKPDAINDGLVNQIVSDLIGAGLRLVHIKPVELNLDQATFIYRDHSGSPNFKFAIDSIMSEGQCKTTLFLLVKHKEKDALTVAQEAKGRADVNGIRAKYRRYHRQELVKKGILGDGLKTLMSRNRLHIPDSNEHVGRILEIVLKPEELGALTKLDPEFKSFVENVKQLVNLETGRSKFSKENI